MIQKPIRRPLVVLLSLVLLLSACRRAKTPEPTAVFTPATTAEVTPVPPTTEPTRTKTSPSTEVAVAPTASPQTTDVSQEPAPIMVSPTVVTGAYPVPELPTPTSTTSSGTPYPAAGGLLPTATSTTSSGTPYPIAETGQSPLQDTPSIPASGTGTLVAGPGTPTSTVPSASGTTYPGPIIPTQTKISAPGVTPTLGTPGPTAALTPSSTPGVVRARIQATDPRTFQIVAGQPQLVEFFTFESPVSRSMAPVVHVLEDRYGDRINFVYLDLDDPANSMFKSMLKGKLPPFFYLLDSQGVVLEEWQGLVPIETLDAALRGVGQ